MEHRPVLLAPTIEALAVKPDGIYVDATLGRGGHAGKLLEKLTSGHLYAFDKDQTALDEASVILAGYGDRLTLIHADYAEMKERLKELGVTSLDGIMMDLGVSSPQFDDGERGFSYRYDARLDMRMDRTQAKSAYDVVNAYDFEALSRILREYGEERYAPAIAKAIVIARRQKPVVTTFELVAIIRQAMPEKELRKKGHPAKKTFQALRIEVNDELTSLAKGIDEALDMLKEGGRLAVITFHSLEDRLVKREFKNRSTAPFVEPKLPLKARQMEQASFRLITAGPIVADEKERAENHRSHSAKLRVIEKIR